MPFWIAGAIVGSSLISSDASQSAADTQSQAQQQAAQTQLQMFNTINQQEQPFVQAGYGATTKLNDLLGLSGNTGADGYGSLTSTFNPTQDQLNNYPGYKFALDQGGQAVRNAATPGSGALSGAALKSLTDFNVGTANKYYGDYFNQFNQQQQNIFERLYGIADLGQNAASNVGTSGTSLGTGAGQAQAAAGASQAAGTIGSANALSGASVPLAYLLSGQGSSSLGSLGGVNNSAGNTFVGTANA